MEEDIIQNNKEETKLKKNLVCKSILVVEDEFISSQLMHKILSNNYEVDVVESADECFKSLINKEYSLIFMDINLGYGTSGLEAVKLLRTQKKILGDTDCSNYCVCIAG